MNKTLFQTVNASIPSGQMTVNEAGGTAYAFPVRHALAQYACTGCLRQTYYTSDEEQLTELLALAAHPEVSEEFLAKTAIYARERGFMKDVPSLLCAVLAARRSALLGKVFPRVIDSPKMLRNFAQVVRSGATGRKSFGTAIRRMIRQWLEARTELQIFNGSVGNKPSMADIIKMVHPHPATVRREALYAYLLGQELTTVQKELLPLTVRQFEAFKAGESTEVPDVPFQFLTSLELTKEQWTEIARNASWQTTRMNLNTFMRHGVFEDVETVRIIADRLRNPEEIRRAKAFPYQLMTAYCAAVDRGYGYYHCDEEPESKIPAEIAEALQDAMERATDNIPVIKGSVGICVDVSGSMSSPVTGYHSGSTSKVMCVDVAGLMASCILRQNPMAEVVPFDSSVREVPLNPRDSVMTNAKKLAALCGGCTCCSSALEYLIDQHTYPDVVIYVSDNESWFGETSWKGTQMLSKWDEMKTHNPKAKLINIDIQPNRSTQVVDREDIVNIGGFSDAVFDFVAQFVSGDSTHWVDLIEAVEL